jgi:hypothetical protein
MTKEITAKPQPGWLDAVAERSKYSRKDIQDFVKKYKIPLTPAIGNPKRIHITGIVFNGKKDGLHSNDFDFRFENLRPGIWGLFSDGNGKGKSTVLEVIKWLFKGRVSDGLQAGVKSWIKFARLSFKVDQINYCIELHQEDELFNGELKRAPQGMPHSSFKTFSSEEEMASIMSDFMLDQLELGQFASYKKGDNELDSGSEVTHGWPALAAAMFIGTSYGAIFGDTAMSGLPNRILNMYMGLPWIPTQAALKALDGQLKGTSVVENLHIDRAMEDRKKRLADIRAQLDERNRAIAKLPEPQKSKQEYNKQIEEYNRAYEQTNESKRRLTEARSEYQIIETGYKADKISLQNFKEDRAANKIFKQLNPTCCPHCEQKITPEQLEKEKVQHTCAICDRTMLDSEDSEELLIELTNNAAATSKAYQESRDLLRQRAKAFENAEQWMQEIKESATTYKSELDAEQHRNLSFTTLKDEINRLKILENEYAVDSPEDLVTTEPTSGLTAGNEVSESKILAAALKETESRFKGLQDDLLQGVNEKMMEYCGKVGLGQYTDLKLNGQPSLKISKDGGETSFSKVSKGEQLRLKVLATIALISVAEERKLGRHPGFLIIDSPAAQEVNQEDLNNLIAGLEELQSSLPSLQIILASVANETLLNHVDEEHRIYAKGQDYLW